MHADFQHGFSPKFLYNLHNAIYFLYSSEDGQRKMKGKGRSREGGERERERIEENPNPHAQMIKWWI